MSSEMRELRLKYREREILTLIDKWGLYGRILEPAKQLLLLWGWLVSGGEGKAIGSGRDKLQVKSKWKFQARKAARKE